MSIQTKTCHAQEVNYQTLNIDAMDPFVIELLGESSIAAYLNDERQKSGAEQFNNAERSAGKLVGELSQITIDAVDRFASDRWLSPDLAPYDAQEYVLALEKLLLLKNEAFNENIRRHASFSLSQIQYRLDLDSVVYATDWNAKQLAASDAGRKTIASAIKAEIFAVPFAAEDLLTEENRSKYHATYQLLLNTDSSETGGNKESRDPFNAMQKQAKKSARDWFIKNKSIFALETDPNSLAHRSENFIQKIQSKMYAEAKKRLIKLSSQAKSAVNDANNGLKYADIHSQKAIAASKNNDAANVASYLNSARESALLLAKSTRELGELASQSHRLRRYMMPEIIDRTQLKQAGQLDTSALEKARESIPSQGKNEYVVARNTIAELIEINAAISKIESHLAEANSNCQKIDDVLRMGEEALEKLTSSSSANASSPFDVSSREAFEASKEKLAESIPTEDYIAFTQAWVKLLQAAIKEDPMVMADDKKYLKFLRENFEGKAVADILGKTP